MMIKSFIDPCTAVYVVVDNLYRAVAPSHDHRPGPIPVAGVRGYPEAVAPRTWRSLISLAVTCGGWG